MKPHLTPIPTNTHFTARPDAIITARTDTQTREPIDNIPQGRASPDELARDERRQAESKKCLQLGLLTGWSMAAMKELRKMNAELRREVAEGQSEIGKLSAELAERRTIRTPSPPFLPTLSSPPRPSTPRSTSDAEIQTQPDTTSTSLTELMARFKRLTKEEIPRLEGELETQRSQLERQSQALAESEDRVAKLETQLGEALSSRLESEVDRAFFEEQANSLRSTVSDNAKQLHDLTSKVEQLRTEASLSHAEASNLRARVSSQTALREKRARDVKVREERLKVLEAEVTALRTGRAIEADKGALNQEAQELKANQKRLEQDLDTTRRQIRTLEDDLRISRRASERMNDQISIEKSRYDDIKSDKEKLENQIEEMKVDAGRTSDAYSTLNDQVVILTTRAKDEQSAKVKALANLRLLEKRLLEVEQVRDEWIQTAQKAKDDLDHAQHLIEAQTEELVKLKEVRRVDQTTQTVDSSTTHTAPPAPASPPTLPPTPLLPPTPTLPTSLSLAPLPLFLPSPSSVHSQLPIPSPSASESQGTTYNGLFTDPGGSPTPTPDEDTIQTEKTIIEVLERNDKLFIRAPKSSRRIRREGFQKVMLNVSPFTVDVCVSWPVSDSVSEDDLVPPSQPPPLLKHSTKEDSESDVSNLSAPTPPVLRTRRLCKEPLSEDSEGVRGLPISFRTRSQSKRKRRHDEMTSESENDATSASDTLSLPRPQPARKRRRTKIILSDDETNSYPSSSSPVFSPTPAPYWPTQQRAYVDVPPLSSNWSRFPGAL